MDATVPRPAAAPTRPLELLDRALAWTRPALVAVPGLRGSEQTPCADWDLAALLAHMLDGFAAFVEGAAGRVLPTPRAPSTGDPAVLAHRLLDLGCGVLGGWATAEDAACRLGPGSPSLSLPSDVVLEIAALEITVHGWDVTQVSAPDRRLPPLLAAALLPVALRHVRADDRPERFGPIVRTSRRDPAALLLAHLGRRPVQR